MKLLFQCVSSAECKLSLQTVFKQLKLKRTPDVGHVRTPIQCGTKGTIGTNITVDPTEYLSSKFQVIDDVMDHIGF